MLDAGRAGPLPAIANSRRFKLCAALAYCASSSTSPLHVTGQRRGLPTPYKLSSAYLLFGSVGADKPGGKFSCFVIAG